MEKHWHGAGPTTAMTHIAIVERLDGKAVDWMEKVSDEERHSKTGMDSRPERIRQVADASLGRLRTDRIGPASVPRRRRARPRAPR
jgi:hypothetical protein